MFSLEQEEIYARYKNPDNAGNLANPSFSIDGANPVCGDVIHLEGRIEWNVLTELVHSGRSCAICTASADLLPELLLNRNIDEILNFPSSKVIERLAIPLSPTRIKCALLPLESLKKAPLKQAEV